MFKFKAFRKLWLLIETRDRKKIYLIFFYMLFGTVLELLGIGLVVPVFAVIGDPELVYKYPAIDPVLNWLGRPNHELIIIYTMLLLLVIYGVKVLFLSFSTYKQSNFIYQFSAKLSSRLFGLYIKQPYAFHLNRNSAELIRNVITDVVMAGSVIQSSIIILTEIFILVSMFLLLLAMEPLGAVISMGVLSGAGWIYHLLTKKRVLNWGKQHHTHAVKRFQFVQEGLGAAKDVKLLGREKSFIDQFDGHNYKMSSLTEKQYTLSQLPRLFIELLAIAGLVLVVLSMIAFDRDVKAILPTLALFAAAAFRLMPSFNRVLANVHTIQYALPSVDSIYVECKTLVDVSPSSSHNILAFDCIILVENMSFQYPGSEKIAVKDVSFFVKKGESVGVIGGSGAGKSTIIDVFLGLLQPSVGKILVDGIDIQTNLRGWQNQIGYVPQSIYLTDDTLRRNIAFGLPSDEIDEKAVIEAVRAAQLEGFISELPQGLDTEVGERGVRLSGGQRQRIGIARALYHNPSVLVLDESTSSLDHETEVSVMEAIKALQGKKTILIVAHRLSTITHCDRIIKFNKGQLMQEGSASVVLNEII